MPVLPPRSALGRTGRWLLVAAAVLVAFVAYQQWGTALAHWQGQRDLRARFDKALIRTDAHRHGTDTAEVAGPAVGDPVGDLVIHRIGLDQVIVEGVQTDQLAVGPGHYPGTPLPGQSGNSAIAGHRTTHGAPFNGLADLQAGDPIEVTTVQGRFTYRVTRSEVVAPDDPLVLAPTTASQLTLTTCTPKYSAARRLIVVARLVTPAAPSTPTTHGGTSGSPAVSDPVRSPVTWLTLVGCCLTFVVLTMSVGSVRRRKPSGRLSRLVPWIALPMYAALVYTAFGVLDTLLPTGF